MINVKNSNQPTLWRKIILAGLVLLVIFLSKSAYDVYAKSRLAHQNQQTAAIRLADLEKREAMLTASITKLKTEAGVEEELRRNLPVVKEGERVVTIVDETKSPTTTAASTSKSWWGKMLGF